MYGEKTIVKDYYSDLVKLNINFRPARNFYRHFVVSREIIDYRFLKLLYDIEYNPPRLMAPVQNNV